MMTFLTNKQKINLDLWLHSLLLLQNICSLKILKKSILILYYLSFKKIWTWIRSKCYFCPLHGMIRLSLSLSLLFLLSFRFFFRFRTLWWRRRWWRITVRWRWWGGGGGAGIIIWVWAWVTGWGAGGWGTWGGRGTDRPVNVM